MTAVKEHWNTEDRERAMAQADEENYLRGKEWKRREAQIEHSRRVCAHVNRAIDSFSGKRKVQGRKEDERRRKCGEGAPTGKRMANEEGAGVVGLQGVGKSSREEKEARGPRNDQGSLQCRLSRLWFVLARSNCLLTCDF